MSRFILPGLEECLTSEELEAVHKEARRIKDRRRESRKITVRQEDGNCNKMHILADMMQSVIDMKKMKEFTSARTPESLDEIMEQLVYILHCEANCGVALAGVAADGGSVEIIDYNAMKEQT